jgi:hypothetical protein
MKTKEISDALDPLVTGGWLEPEAPHPSNRSWTIHPALRDSMAEHVELQRVRREEARQLVASIGKGQQ